MHPFHCPIRRPRPWCRAISLLLIVLWLVLVPAAHSTVKVTPPPVRQASEAAPGLAFSAAPPPVRAPIVPEAAGPNPVALALISAFPLADGESILISAVGVGASSTPIFLNVDPGTGPSGHQKSYAMTLSGNSYLATAVGFAPGQDIGSDGDDTLNITTTVGSALVSSGAMSFQRAFVQPAQPEMIFVDHGNFTVEMPNLGTVPADMYLMVMAINVAPAALPIGYGLAGGVYNASPSGSLIQTEKFMTLRLRYKEQLLGGHDPHTLAVAGCHIPNCEWQILGGNLFDDDQKQYLTLPTKTFGVYTLVTTPTWRDSFMELSLSGVAARANTQWGPGDTIILSSGAISGTVTSIPIAPPAGARGWGTLHYGATAAANTALTVDLLDANDQVVLAGVPDGADLAGLSLATYPTLKLRATLTTMQAGATPVLQEWSIGWMSNEYRVYLPSVLR